MSNPQQINAEIALLPLAEVPEPVPEAARSDARLNLGDPLSIREVAKMLGCSAWTVRHSYLPQGLPHFRSGPTGKLVFFRNQVVRWILQQQQRKGGI
jgi:DNA-directed RNA polymerase specialized sigma24 family protein